MRVDLIQCGPAVSASERRAIKQLKARLIGAPGDGEWLLLTNLTFSADHRFQSDEIDIVVVGPPGVRIIEVKHWTAAWVRSNGELVAAQAERVSRKAKKIGTAARRTTPAVAWVEGVFLTTQTRSKVKRLEGRIERGVPFYTLRTGADAVGIGLPQRLSPREVAATARALAPREVATSSGALRHFAGYGRLELASPPDQRFHRVYRGTHSSRQDRVYLHLYDLSASGNAKAEAKARREFDSLSRLQEYSWAPRIIDSFQDALTHPGELKFFTVADPAAPSVDERSADAGWGTAARLAFACRALRALGALHAAGAADELVLRCNLSPRSILVRHDDRPLFAELGQAFPGKSGRFRQPAADWTSWRRRTSVPTIAAPPTDAPTSERCARLWASCSTGRRATWRSEPGKRLRA